MISFSKALSPAFLLSKCLLRLWLSCIVAPSLARELVNAREGHEGLDTQEVPTEWVDLEGVFAPDEAGDHDYHLLRSGQVLRWHPHIPDIGDCNAPLKGRRPEEDREGPSRTEEPRPQPGRERQRTHCQLLQL